MENFEKSGKTKNQKEFRRQLIQKEFRNALASIKYEIPTKTEGVVILSGGEFIKEGGRIDYLNPVNAENKTRIEMGIEVIKQIVAHKANKDVSEIKNEDILKYAPSLVLSGTTEQLPIMRQIVEGMNFPSEKMELVDCGASSVGNTKTQFKTINDHYINQRHNHITFITSDYHVPRVVRTGRKNLNADIDFDVIPVPHEKTPYNVFKIVRGEVKRIISYSDKGDISKNVPPHLKKK